MIFINEIGEVRLFDLEVRKPGTHDNIKLNRKLYQMINISMYSGGQGLFVT